VTSWTVRQFEEVSYQVRRTHLVLNPANDALARAARFAAGSRRLFIVDWQVDELHGGQLREYIHHFRVKGTVVPVRSGEPNKTTNTVLGIFDAIGSLKINRRDPITVIGGGVLTDVVGLAASLYRRGTPYVRVPTTLVGLIDAGVGIKTGMNYNGMKNLIGSYYAPTQVLLDPAFIRTLPERHIRNGLAESIKLGIILDRALFELIDANLREIIDSHLNSPVGDELIDRSVDGMLNELRRNLWERELRRLVDFGHTFSPRLELLSNGELLHGEAVAVDMALSCVLAGGRGLMPEDDVIRSIVLLARAGLPVAHRLCTPEQCSEALAETVRHRDGNQHCPLPTGIGRACFVEDLSGGEIASAVEQLTKYVESMEL
jgi:2-epi-5-epi-valiolone synthase